MDKQKFLIEAIKSIYGLSFTRNQPFGESSYMSLVAYNTIVHTTTGMSPFQAICGKAPPSIPNYIVRPSNAEAMDTSLATREEIVAL